MVDLPIVREQGRRGCCVISFSLRPEVPVFATVQAVRPAVKYTAVQGSSIALACLGFLPLTQDSNTYLKKNLKDVLPHALHEICQTRPADPIDYLAKYLYRSVDSGIYYQEKALFSKEMQRMTIKMKNEQQNRLKAIAEHKKQINELKRVIHTQFSHASGVGVYTTLSGRLRRKTARSFRVESETRPQPRIGSRTSVGSDLDALLETHLRPRSFRRDDETRSIVWASSESVVKFPGHTDEGVLERSFSSRTSRSDLARVSIGSRSETESYTTFSSKKGQPTSEEEREAYKAYETDFSRKVSVSIKKTKRLSSRDDGEFIHKKMDKTHFVTDEDRTAYQALDSDISRRTSVKKKEKKSLSDEERQLYEKYETELSPKTRDKKKEKQRSLSYEDRQLYEKYETELSPKTGDKKKEKRRALSYEERQLYETVDSERRRSSRKTIESIKEREKSSISISHGGSETTSEAIEEGRKAVLDRKASAFRTASKLEEDVSKFMPQKSVTKRIKKTDESEIGSAESPYGPESPIVTESPGKRPKVRRRLIKDIDSQEPDVEPDLSDQKETEPSDATEDSQTKRKVKKRVKKIEKTADEEIEYDESTKMFGNEYETPYYDESEKVRSEKEFFSERESVSGQDFDEEESEQELEKGTEARVEKTMEEAKRYFFRLRTSSEADKGLLDDVKPVVMAREKKVRREPNIKKVESDVRISEYAHQTKESAVESKQKRKKPRKSDESEETEQKKKLKRRSTRQSIRSDEGEMGQPSAYSSNVSLIIDKSRSVKSVISSPSLEIGIDDISTTRKGSKKPRIVPVRKKTVKAKSIVGTEDILTEPIEVSDSTFMRETSLPAYVSDSEEELIPEVTFTPVECEWLLTGPRILICRHPVLGEIRSQPQSISAAQCFTGWADRPSYVWQAFYDPEVYTVPDPFMDDARYRRKLKSTRRSSSTGQF